MSLPQFPSKDRLPTLEQSLSAIVTSIAMEEVALSHVLTAESEKIKYVVDCAKSKGCDCASIKDILAVNNSAANMIKTITELQMILKDKLAIASKHLPVKPYPPKPPCPPHPPHPPKPPCPPYPPHPTGMSVFETVTPYTWCRSKTIFLVEHEKYGSDVKLIRRDGQSLIILPGGKEIDMRFELEAVNKRSCPVVIHMEFLNAGKIVKQETIASKSGERHVKILHEISYKTPVGAAENAIAYRLSSPESLRDVHAKILVKVKK